jgi:hypothetical protein
MYTSIDSNGGRLQGLGDGILIGGISNTRIIMSCCFKWGDIEPRFKNDGVRK